uniref:Uncharacterized protein n=1 Tax=Noctiluca scintillans TaxID=2966 RepID=A0A7S1AF87_NOCSC|mmetsp:Transcript_44032/g.116457  ORF Transcript_44032/g.116457 Transcript_44032/m.116457 type:complete len:475 (+) Transcript_44032:52-1476(+)
MSHLSVAFASLLECATVREIVQNDCNSQAMRLLETIRHACDELARLQFPNGAAREMAVIKAATYKLEVFVRDTKDMVQLPWSRPPEEQAEWEERCPSGGSLLRRQVCLAAIGDHPTEWFMGCLSISDKGLLFEDEGTGFAATSQIGEIFEYGTGFNDGDLQAWNSLTTGLVEWNEIVSLQRCDHDRGPVTVTILLSKFPHSPLHLQLGLRGEVSWLVRTWTMCAENSSDVEKQLSSLELHSLVDVNHDENCMGNMECPGNGDGACRRLLVPRESSFFSAVASLPAPTRPVGEHLISGKVDNVDFGKFQNWFSTGWPIARYMEEWLEAEDINFMPWANGRAVDTRVRKGTCSVRLCDIPWAVKMVASFPATSDVTVLFSLRDYEQETILVQQTMVSGVPFATAFKAQDIVSFSPTADGGMEIRKWHDLVWVSQVPGVLKSFLSKSAREITKVNAPPFVKILEDEVRQNNLWKTAP